MKPTLTLTDLFGSRGRADVLRVLWGIRVPVTAAEVARRTRLTHPAASSTLRGLADDGLVASAPAGRGSTYWLIRENVYVEEILDPAFLAERDIPDMMLAAIEDALNDLAVSLVLFGSYARGDQTTDSDVDLVAVSADEATRPTLQDAVNKLAADFPSRFGAHLSAIVYTLPQAARLVSRSAGLYQSLRNEGLRISGLDVGEWEVDEE